MAAFIVWKFAREDYVGGSIQVDRSQVVHLSITMWYFWALVIIFFMLF